MSIRAQLFTKLQIGPVSTAPRPGCLPWPDGWLRVSIGTPEEMAAFEDALVDFSLLRTGPIEAHQGLANHLVDEGLRCSAGQPRRLRCAQTCRQVAVLAVLLIWLAVAAAAVTLSACQTASPPEPLTASAGLQPTKGSKVYGEATFEQVGANKTINVAANPTAMEIRVPQRSRESTSRPWESVPSQCSRLGALSMAA